MAKSRAREAELASPAKSGASKTGKGSQGSPGGADGPAGGGNTAKRASGAKSGAARGATAKGRAGTSSRASGGKSAGEKSAATLRKDLRDFAGSRPQGWSHDDWLRFLDDLQARGHNINDRDAIGSMLERERLALALEKIPGLGPQRVRAIADRYGYLWRLRETNVDQLLSETNVPRPVAEKVVEALGS
jgi:hypothetical protein